MTLVVAISTVRDFIEANGSTASKYSDGAIGSNISTAAAFLERRTERVWVRQTATTKLFTTNGRPEVTIPGLATATAVTLQNVALVADQTSGYSLIPDAQQTGLYTGIRVHPFGNDYRGNPEWFDRNLDQPLWRNLTYWYLPNDLSASGDWGVLPANYPEEFLKAVVVMAGWYTKLPDTLLANVAITAEGTALDYSQNHPVVRDFVEAYRLRADQVVTVG